MISVIVPVYRTEEYLRKCVDSILRQTWEDFELLLIDDGSPDGSGIICDQYAKQDNRVSVIHKPNGGLSDARNAGIEAAKGEYITFVDSDDWVAPELLETLLSGIRLGAQISVCGFYTVRNEQEKPWRESSDEIHLLSSLEATRDMMYARSMDTSAWGKLFHRSCFLSIRFPEGVLYEEVATTYRLFLTQQTVAVTTRPLYYYVKRPGSIVTSAYQRKDMDMMRFSQEMLAFAEAHEPSLIPAAKRRIVYACCFLLKTMGKHYREFPDDVRTIRKLFCQYRTDVIRDPDASGRDKTAIALLSAGVGSYIGAWSVYSGLTGRHGNA